MFMLVNKNMIMIRQQSTYKRKTTTGTQLNGQARKKDGAERKQAFKSHTRHEPVVQGKKNENVTVTRSADRLQSIN